MNEFSHPDQTVKQADSPGPGLDSTIVVLPQLIGRYRIERVLGQGGFGIVYLAHDDQLQRAIAIKVPHANLVAQASDADAYLVEARTVANLDHPNIVPVHDVGRTDQHPCFVVSKYIDGTDLATRLKESPLPLHEAVMITAIVAEALHYAHQQGLVHRDIKPGNILLDKCGKPFVGDFGLALREKDVGKGPQYAGTPSYMSPEQARGEGHRVDGRSDIFSLGVVFYEMLTGRRPFKADSQDELLEQITSVEARPLRQISDAIPRELDRICLKALAKRASERYSTAKDMAEDLRHFLADATPAEISRVTEQQRSETVVATPLPTPTTPPASNNSPVKIVPPGLRSFDAHDADFFLELLPGARDRDGLPDSIRFWKTRIEEMDCDNTFSVGLIYGPSGCGKSSLVKAGLLPRLSDEVIAVYVEATAEETEARLLNGLRKRCPGLASNLSLKETLAAARRGQGIPAGKKVVVILDQFEQWLHARKDEPNSELIQALRQCDGGRVQCVVMVRDDFWLAVSRFMKELEVRLVEDQNSTLIDLFDMDHAQKVLAAFGRAFGKLPDNPNETSREQKEFLKQAVSGLAQEGKIICVRLALFAEMMKGKPWTPASLKEVGGTEGVGIAFLEETFSSTTAPPEHRYHQKAAKAVLKMLLPEAGTNIKGHMRSRQELLNESGYANRPKDFDDVINVLDGGIRLITPTDPEGKDDADSSTVQAAGKYYQLTHDYLVPSLRDWLTRKQKETRRGRAELLLADRATVWNGRMENRQLPSLWQWGQIRWMTARKNWTTPQRKMMSKATRYHALRGMLLILFLTLVGVGSWEGYGRYEARRLMDRLMESNIADVPGIVKEMAPYRRWVNPLLQEARYSDKYKAHVKKVLRISLALLPVDSDELGFLARALLSWAEPQEVLVIREALKANPGDLAVERFWELMENPKTEPGERLRSAILLAAFAHHDPRWEKASGDIADILVNQEPFLIAQWTEALKGIRRWQIPHLAGFLIDEKRTLPSRGLTAKVYGIYADAEPEAYEQLENQLEQKPATDASVETKVALAKKQASIGVALMVMGKSDKVWPLLKHSNDPTLRSYLIDRFAPAGVEYKILLKRLDKEQNYSIKQAILQSLGEYGLDRMPPSEQRNQFSQLLRIYKDDSDPGVHGAVEWLLRQWQATEDLKKIDKELATGKLDGKRQWYLNRHGDTMVIIPKPGEFWMGEGEERHRKRIDRNFAIASKEVTVHQFLKYRKEHEKEGEYDKRYAPNGDSPIIMVSWYDATAYCNWLSEQEGIPKEQWCYEPNKEGKYSDGMTMAADYLKRTGYRLPTEAEWEYACRAGSVTSYSCGDSVEILCKYGWSRLNSSYKSHPVGSLKSNDLGLFDMHGNEWEWCQDAYVENRKKMESETINDIEETNSTILGTDPMILRIERVARSGYYSIPPSEMLSASRSRGSPASSHSNIGFRVTRTLPLDSFTALPLRDDSAAK